MDLKVIRAATMPDAMARLRAELGAEALILSARTLKDGVEVTADIDPQEQAPGLAVETWRARCAHHAIPLALARRLSARDLPGSLAAALKFAPIATEAGPLLFVGPPGAGKTSSVARLATRLVLAGGRPLVITADGRRAGATEQLAAFTRLLGLSLVVATHPLTLARAVARAEPGEAVLIDAPGSDSQSFADLQEMAALAEAAGARAALVLPGGMDAGEAADIAAAYEHFGATLLVATRLDLARRLGSVLAAARVGNLALAEAGIGPGAADGLVPCTPALLAGRLMRFVPPGMDARQAPRQEELL